MHRTRVRVKKWRGRSIGWLPVWRVVSCVSAVISLTLAGVFIFLLIKLLFADDLGHLTSMWEPQLLQWPWLGHPPSATFAAAPEPSRAVLLLVAMIAAALRRRR